MIDREIGPPPSERTVARYLKEFRALPEEEIARYRVFEWPTAMLKGYLPWEASAFVLTLQFQMQHMGKETLTVLEMQWHWRISQALPTLPLNVRMKVVQLYAEAESGDREPPNIMEILEDYTIAR